MTSGVELKDYEDYRIDVETYASDMTLKDYFAAKAMPLIYREGINAELLASQCYDIAEAFMIESSRRSEESL